MPTQNFFQQLTPLENKLKGYEYKILTSNYEEEIIKNSQRLLDKLYEFEEKGKKNELNTLVKFVAKGTIVQAHNNLAKAFINGVYGYIKDYDLARGYYQRALDMDPHNTIAKSGLRLLNSIQTNTQQANNNLQLR